MFDSWMRPFIQCVTCSQWKTFHYYSLGFYQVIYIVLLLKFKSSVTWFVFFVISEGMFSVAVIFLLSWMFGNGKIYRAISKLRLNVSTKHRSHKLYLEPGLEISQMMTESSAKYWSIKVQMHLITTWTQHIQTEYLVLWCVQDILLCKAQASMLIIVSCSWQYKTFLHVHVLRVHVQHPVGRGKDTVCLWSITNH